MTITLAAHEMRNEVVFVKLNLTLPSGVELKKGIENDIVSL
jgi:hypothetical protein